MLVIGVTESSRSSLESDSHLFYCGNRIALFLYLYGAEAHCRLAPCSDQLCETVSEGPVLDAALEVEFLQEIPAETGPDVLMPNKECGRMQ